MYEFFSGLVDANRFMPHGHCYLWEPSILWTHVISDALIAAAYYSIPIALYVFARKRTDLGFSWILMLFAIFIFACGTNHVLDIVTTWVPMYRLEATGKAFTAAASVLTAVVLWPLIPKAMAIPNPDDLREKNAELEAQIEKLRAAERSFNLLFERNPAANLLVDGAGRIQLTNSAANGLFGRSGENLAGSSIDEFVPETQRGKHEGLRLGFMQSPEARAMSPGRELEAVGRDGQRIPVSVTLTPIELDEGLHVLASVADLRERQKLDDERRRVEALEHTNRELSDFAHVIAHDLKAPQRAIRSITSWLVEDLGDTLDEQSRENLELLRTRSMRMDALIDGVLSYSKAAGEDANFEDVDAGQAAHDAITNLGDVGNARIDVADDLPTIEHDRTQLVQIYQNLIGNAVRFHDRGDAHIRVGHTREHGRLELFVRDDGPGIKPEHQDRIFRLFQTLQPRDEFESTGVGLAIVKKLVERNGGEVRVESDLGAGATFYFSVREPEEPAAEGEVDAV